MYLLVLMMTWPMEPCHEGLPAHQILKTWKATRQLQMKQAIVMMQVSKMLAQGATCAALLCRGEATCEQMRSCLLEQKMKPGAVSVVFPSKFCMHACVACKHHSQCMACKHDYIYRYVAIHALASMPSAPRLMGQQTLARSEALYISHNITLLICNADTPSLLQKHSNGHIIHNCLIMIIIPLTNTSNTFI